MQRKSFYCLKGLFNYFTWGEGVHGTVFSSEMWFTEKSITVAATVDLMLFNGSIENCAT